MSDTNVSSTKKPKSKNLSETSSEDLLTNNMDSNLKKILNNDLKGADSETEGSLNFKPENSIKSYQEVFSNSVNEQPVNSQQKNEEINKNKFFSNYLQF